MTTNTYPRLCGGTFFTLVLQALRQRMKAKEHYKGDSDGLSDPEVLMGLIKVINPDFQKLDRGILKSKANEYKSCKISRGAYLPFGDTQEVRTFDGRVKNDYYSALNDMAEFVNAYLDLGSAVGKKEHLVKAIIELIQQDETISESEEFFVGEGGQKIKKAAFGGLKYVCLPAFLLGVWHYVVVNRKDNTVGKNTYDIWCPSTGGGPRIYIGHMGEGILNDLTIYLVDTASRPKIDVEPVDTVVIKESPEQPAQQTVNNPFVFNFYQYGNNGTQIGHIENYYGGKKKEK